MRKLKNIWAFYTSIFLINFGVSLAAGVFSGWGGFSGSFLAFGFILSLAVKEVNAKKEYVFYQNNGLSRARLWISAYLLNIAVCLFAITIFVLCRTIF